MLSVVFRQWIKEIFCVHRWDKYCFGEQVSSRLEHCVRCKKIRVLKSVRGK